MGMRLCARDYETVPYRPPLLADMEPLIIFSRDGKGSCLAFVET